MKHEHSPMLSESSDAELLSQLRAGEAEAYTELWRRHIRAALRLAHRLMPERAEDLASESFLAVYHQITVSGNGPESAFRAYLFTTMRNTAMKWGKEARLVDTDSELDSIDLQDALSTLEDRAQSAEMLDAFQALPERWQRVLWLTEVEQARRPEIATDLSIKPNAVSALYRRARTGLRLQWRTQQVPPELRDDPAHVAGQLPKLALDGKAGSPGKHVAEHLRQCVRCSELRDGLLASSERMHRKSLAVAGFAALGVVLPAASHTSIAVVGAGAAAAILAIAGASLVASIGVLAIGLPASEMRSAAPTQEAETPPHSTGTNEQQNDDSGTNQSETDRSGGSDEAPLIGRGNNDPAIADLSFGTDQPPNYDYNPPARPTPASPGDIPDPSAGQGEDLRAGVTTPSGGTSYLAPVLAGATTPGASIAVEIERVSPAHSGSSKASRYEAAVEEHGEWRFDLRTLVRDQPGQYEYRVWAYTEQASSPTETGSFTLSPPGVTGFEGIAPFEPVPLAEASSSGIVFRAHGPANGTICLVSIWSGQSAEIALDQDGVAVRRVKMLTGGAYFFDFRACEGGFLGPATEILFDVDDPDGPGFGFFGNDPSTTLFELEEL